MSTVLKSVFANPRVTPGVMIALLLVALVTVPRGVDAVQDRWQRWQLDRGAYWTAERWALTADEFPGHDTDVIVVEPWQLTRARGDGRTVHPFATSGLAPLFHDSPSLGLRFEGYFTTHMDATEAVSGVRIDDVEAYTYVSAPWGRSYDQAGGAEDVWDLRSSLTDRSRTIWSLLHGLEQRPLPDRSTVLSVGYVGDRVDLEELRHSEDEPFDAGDTGYFGVTTHQRAPDGDEFRTTTVATVVEGALVTVGVVVPDGVKPAADLEPALLLERLAAEVRANPPSHTAPVEAGVPGDGVQADSRTTSGVGSVMAAGS